MPRVRELHYRVAGAAVRPVPRPPPQPQRRRAASSFAATRRCRTRPTCAAWTCTPACATPSATGSCACTASASRSRWRWWPTCRRRWASKARSASSTCWPTSPRAWPGRPGAPATASASSAATSACVPTSALPQTRSRGAGAALAQRLRGLRADGAARRARLREAHRHLPRRRALVFLVSDFHLPLAELEAVLDSLASHDVVPIVLWQPVEFALGAAHGLAQVREPESGARALAVVAAGAARALGGRARGAPRGAAAGLPRAAAGAAVHRGRFRCRRRDAALPRMKPLLALLAVGRAAALAQARRRRRCCACEASEPRAYGYQVGDAGAAPRHRARAGRLALDEASLPRPGGRGQALELRHVEHRSAAEARGCATNSCSTTRCSWRRRRCARWRSRRCGCALTAAARSEELLVEAWPVTIAPLVPVEAPTRRGLGELQPDRPPPLIDTTAQRAAARRLRRARRAAAGLVWPWLLPRPALARGAQPAVRRGLAAAARPAGRPARAAVARGLRASARGAEPQRRRGAVRARARRLRRAPAGASRPLRDDLARFLQMSRAEFFGGAVRGSRTTRRGWWRCAVAAATPSGGWHDGPSAGRKPARSPWIARRTAARVS